MRALKGPVPLGPMPNEPALEVAVLPMKGWARRKSLDVTMNEYKMIGMNIQGQTGAMSLNCFLSTAFGGLALLKDFLHFQTVYPPHSPSIYVYSEKYSGVEAEKHIDR